MTKNFKYLFLLTLSGGLILASCSKDEENVVEEVENYTVEEELQAAAFSQDIEDAIDDELEDYGFNFAGDDSKEEYSKGPTAGANDNCANREMSEERGTFPNTVTITLGDGCTGRHGQSVTGQIEITLSAPMRETGSTRTITLTNLDVNGVIVNGTKTVTNNGRDSNQRWSFTKSTDITITNGDRTISRASNITWTVTAGDDTATHRDDSVERTGTIQGINSRGENYSVVITTPLLRLGNCRWPVSGVKEVTRAGRTVTIDYGDGTCDRTITATLGDVSRDFTIGGN